MVTDYVRLIVFAAGLLVGVQLPNFVDQYAKRVSAHQIEVTTNFRGFQGTADRFYGGNVEALIAHHTASPDPVFQSEARSIREMYDRLLSLTAELAAMTGPLIRQIFHVAFSANREMLAETRSAYTYTVPLNGSAIVCGVSIGALLAILVELVLRLGMSLVGRTPRRQTV